MCTCVHMCMHMHMDTHVNMLTHVGLQTACRPMLVHAHKCRPVSAVYMQSTIVYIQCTHRVHTMYIQCTYSVHTVYMCQLCTYSGH